MRCIVSGKETKLTTMGRYPICREFTRMIAGVRDDYQAEQRLKVEEDVKANNNGNNLSEESLKVLVDSLAPRISRRTVIDLVMNKNTRVLQMFGMDVDEVVKNVALDAAKGME